MRITSALCCLSLGGVGVVAHGAPPPVFPGVWELPSENPDPFWEPTESEFWGGANRGDGAQPRTLQPVRLTNTTTAVFEAYIRRGIPVIVTDAARGWSEGGMGDWTCESVRAMFKGQHAPGDAPIFL